MTMFASCDPEENDPINPDAPAFTEFSFTGIAGSAVIDPANRTVKATAQCGTNLASLTPEFKLSPEGTTAKVGSKPQTSGTTTVNCSEPVVYTLATPDGETAEWKVTVKLPDDCPPPAEEHTVYFDEISAHSAPNIQGNRTTHIEINLRGTGIDDIEKEDIIITPQGVLTGQLVWQSNFYDDENEYLLILYPNGVSATQNITVTFQKAGYTFIPASRQVPVSSN